MKKYIVVLFGILAVYLAVVEPLAAEEVFFYHVDAVGTPLAMTNATGQKVWEADYKPFGEEYAITTSSEPNDRRFVGKEKDEETSLNYFGARYLSAGNGRFLAPDPVRAVDGETGRVNYLILVDPQRINAYSYSLNNPYRYVDPDGKFGWLLIPVFEYGVPALITAMSAKAIVDTNNALKSRVYQESALPASPEITPSDLEGKAPEEIRKLAEDNGLLPVGDKSSPDYPRKWKDPATGKERLRIDKGHSDPNTGKPYNDPNAAADHSHGYDVNGKPIVNPSNGNKHFPNISK